MGANPSPETIVPNAVGTFDVQTAAGTCYVLHLDGADTVIRKPGLARPVDGEEVTRRPGDFDEHPLIERSAVVVGSRMELTYAVGEDIVVHTSSPVTAIEER